MDRSRKIRKFPQLSSERLLLRQFTLRDTEPVFAIFSRPEVTAYYNLETLTERLEARNLVLSRRSLFINGQGLRWAILRKDNPKNLIGSCGFYNLNSQYHSAEIGYDLHPEYWHQGYMGEALTTMLDFGFSSGFFFTLNRVEALCMPANIASIRILEKLGFCLEGLRRQYGFWKGMHHDVVAYALLREDWKKMRYSSQFMHIFPDSQE
ncbi:MAG: GNAT family N-acetyltransferase [Candidatus Cloacimonetes bacterium]|nr:GNAT family N-acetyltransferase [Candidatus Cloacimonadota bacterium]